MMASMGFVGSVVFYNAFLPEIAAPEDRDRVSAKGFSYGYIGSVILQMIGFVLVILLPADPFLATQNYISAGWHLVGFFCTDHFCCASRDQVRRKNKFTVLSAESFSEMKKVYREIKKLPVLKNFLRGYSFFTAWGYKQLCWLPLYSEANCCSWQTRNSSLPSLSFNWLRYPGAIWMSQFVRKIWKPPGADRHYHLLDPNLPGCLLYGLF